MRILNRFGICEKIILNLLPKVNIQEMYANSHEIFCKCYLKQNLTHNTKLYIIKPLTHEKVGADYYEKDFIMVFDFYDSSTNDEGDMLIRINLYETDEREKLANIKAKMDFHVYYNVEKNELTYKLGDLHEGI